MGEGFQFIDIILFAMIAAFLILRLRSVLGRRQDNGGPPSDPFSRGPRHEPQDDNVVQLPDQSEPPDVDGEPAKREPATPLEAGFTQIQIADPTFDQEEFLVGARTAFEFIIQAFAEGDTETLESLLNDEVYRNFLSAIRSREAANETLENTLVRICAADAIEAYMDGAVAFVTMKIVSEQVNVTRDAAGEAVDGDPGHITEITDIWTFGRDTNSRDPNWELVATRSLE